MMTKSMTFGETIYNQVYDNILQVPTLDKYIYFEFSFISTSLDCLYQLKKQSVTFIKISGSVLIADLHSQNMVFLKKQHR